MEDSTAPAIPEEDLARMSVWGANTDAMLAGLRTVLRVQTKRFQDAAEREQANIERREKLLADGEVLSTSDTGLDSRVSTLGKQVFEQSVALLKLIDPNMAASGAARINIQVNNGRTGNNAPTAAAAPRVLVAELIREMKAAGIDTDKVDSEAILQMVANRQRPALEATGVEQTVIDPGIAKLDPTQSRRPTPAFE